jgi:hypothetical protein
MPFGLPAAIFAAFRLGILDWESESDQRINRKNFRVPETALVTVF